MFSRLLGQETKRRAVRGWELIGENVSYRDFADKHLNKLDVFAKPILAVSVVAGQQLLGHPYQVRGHIVALAGDHVIRVETEHAIKYAVSSRGRKPVIIPAPILDMA